MLEGTAHLTDVRLAREALAWAPLECFTQALDAVAHAQGVA
jgi:hypothetical protein